jgi:hypothetical protein
MLMSGRARPDESELVCCSSGAPSVFLPRSIVNLRKTFTRVKACLLQTGKVEPQRITESARSANTKGSRVYVRLQ